MAAVGSWAGRITRSGSCFLSGSLTLITCCLSAASTERYLCRVLTGHAGWVAPLPPLFELETPRLARGGGGALLSFLSSLAMTGLSVTGNAEC